MSKIKTFLTDSQPGYVLSTYVLKILVNLSLNVLIKKVLIKKTVRYLASCSKLLLLNYLKYQNHFNTSFSFMSITYGTTSVYPSRGFDPGAVLTAIQQEK